MKTLRTSLFLFILILSKGLFAQTNATHPTVSDVKVRYKSVPTQTVSGIQAIPEATVSLKTTSGVSKIYFKILDNVTNAVVYEVNYSVNASPVTNAEGKKLFENIDGVIFISNGQAVTLKPYSYQVYTQDSQSNSTTVFSVIQ